MGFSWLCAFSIGLTKILQAFLGSFGCFLCLSLSMGQTSSTPVNTPNLSASKRQEIWEGKQLQDLQEDTLGLDPQPQLYEVFFFFFERYAG